MNCKSKETSYELAYEIAQKAKRALHLPVHEVEMLEHDINNLRANEWVDVFDKLSDRSEVKKLFFTHCVELEDENDQELEENMRNYCFTPYGYRDAIKVLNGKAPTYYYHLKEIKMDSGDGAKLANYAKKLGLNVIQDPDSDPDYPTWYIPGEYHWDDYFYPYPFAHESKVDEGLIQSSSDKAFQQNIKTEIKAGKKPEQAVAIAYQIQKQNKNENLKEDIMDNIEDQSYTKDQLFSELKNATNNFTINNDYVIVGYEDEKNYVIEILSEHDYECECEKKGEYFYIKFWKEKVVNESTTSATTLKNNIIEKTKNGSVESGKFELDRPDEADYVMLYLIQNLNYHADKKKKENGDWEVSFWKKEDAEEFQVKNFLNESFNCQCSNCKSKYSQLPLGKYGIIICSQCGGKEIKPLPKDGTIVECPSCKNNYLLSQSKLKYDVPVCDSCGDQLITKADSTYMQCDSCGKFINIRKNRKCPICGGSPITEGYSKYGHSWEERNGMIHIYEDGKLIDKFPSMEAADEAGWDLDNLRESRDPFDHHDPEYSEKEAADTIAYEFDRAKNLKYDNSIDEKENKGLREYYDEYGDWVPDVKKPKSIKGSDFEEFCDYYMTKYDFECRAKYADFSEKNGMVEVQYLAQEYMDENAALYLGDLVNKWMVNNGYQGKTIEIAASDRSGDYSAVYIKFIAKRGYETTEDDLEYEYEVNDINDTFDPEWFDNYDDALKFAENKAKDQYVRRNTDWIGIHKCMKNSDDWEECGGVDVESLLDPEDKESVLEWIDDNVNLSDEEFEKFQLKSLEEIIAFIKQDSSLHIKFKEDFGDDDLNESLDQMRSKALKMKETSNAFAILYGYNVKGKEVELEPEEFATEEEYKDRIQQITNSFTKLSDKDPRGNRYGKESGIEFYAIYPNKNSSISESTMMDTLKAKYPVLDNTWTMGSDKTKLNNKEFELLYALADKLTSTSPNQYKYEVKETYEDYGAGMKWYNIICTDRKGNSWQVLNTKDWLDLMNTGDVDSVYQSVVNDKYFQDKSKAIHEMNMWEMFESIKED